MEPVIRAKAMCVIEKNGFLLASKGYDSVKNTSHHRLLGGSIEFGETAEAAMRREIHEELGSALENLEQIGVVENIFTYNGAPGHEIIFVFAGELVRQELYETPTIVLLDAPTIEAVWVPVEDVISGAATLYPSFDYSQAVGK